MRAIRNGLGILCALAALPVHAKLVEEEFRSFKDSHGAKLKITRLKSSLSNIYVLESDSKIAVIDPGPLEEAPELISYLQQKKGKTLSCLLLTHGHSDHAGATSPLKTAFSQAKIVSGREEAMTQTGENRELKPTGKVFARALKPMFEHQHFPPFKPDLTLSGSSLDLQAPCSLPIRAMSTPGHTVGSASYAFGDYVVVGDLIQGGWLNGAVQNKNARTSFFHGDPGQNLQQLKGLADQGFRDYLPGHGAILPREQIEAYLNQNRDASRGSPQKATYQDFPSKKPHSTLPKGP